MAVPATPADRPEQSCSASAVHATWFVGGRFTRQEWYDPRTGALLGQATVVGAVRVGDRRAVRVRLPVNSLYGEGSFEATHYADLDPATRLPLRFVFELDGQTRTYVLTIRRIPRSALPPNFFSTKRR